VPVIVAVTSVETAAVVMVNVAVVEPAATKTEDGTVALTLLEDRVTAAPPVPAGPVNVTVPVDVLPPMTEFGDTAMLDRLAAKMAKDAVLVTPPSVPVIVAVILLGTGDVVIVNVAVVAPAATIIDDGMVAFIVLDDRLTTAPPAGAAKVSVTVPVAAVPPTTEFGETVRPFSSTMPKVGFSATPN
jgi:hypothetical protein